MSITTRPLVWIAFGFVSLASVQARAQDAFGWELFEPLPSQGANLLNLGRSDLLRHLEPSVGLFFHYEDDPVELERTVAGQRVRETFVDNALLGELSLGFGLFDVVDLGLTLPLVLSQEGHQLDGTTLDGFAVNDLRLVGKVRLVDPKRAGGFGLALMGTLSIPVGDEEMASSYGTVHGEPRLVMDYRFGADGVVLSANVGYHFAPTRRVTEYEVGSALRWGVGVEVPIVKRTLSLMAVGYGDVLTVDDPYQQPIEALGGLRWWLADDWVAQVGAGAGFNDGVGAPDVRVFASFGYTPTRDHDQCPNEPEDEDGFQDDDGCPDPDNDGDGVLDVDDGERDASGYGRCRNQPEDKDGFEDQDGCPDTDNDRDGIPDVADGARDASGFGVCRDEPEDFDGVDDGDGCPDPDVAKPEATVIVITEIVYFDFNKATLKPESVAILDQVVSVLKQHDELARVRIEGNADIIGTEDYNQALSERRAETVKRYLVDHGIAADRLETVGYGFSKPKSTNDTQEGRDLNRRVEFVIVTVNGKPTLQRTQ